MPFLTSYSITNVASVYQIKETPVPVPFFTSYSSTKMWLQSDSKQVSNSQQWTNISMGTCRLGPCGSCPGRHSNVTCLQRPHMTSLGAQKKKKEKKRNGHLLLITRNGSTRCIWTDRSVATSSSSGENPCCWSWMKKRLLLKKCQPPS